MKKKFTIFLLLFVSSIASIAQSIESQSQVYEGDILNNKNYIFLGKIDSSKTKFDDKHLVNIYKIPSILLSTNEIEIRCEREVFETEYSLIVLAYKNNKWSYNYYFQDHSSQRDKWLQKYTNDTSMYNFLVNHFEERYSKKRKYEQTRREFNLDSLFNVLALNNIFSQNDTFHDNVIGIMYNAYSKKSKEIVNNTSYSITGGEGCTIYYKIQNVYGQFYISNVNSYFRSYPNNNQLREQNEIYRVFEFISNQ